MPQQIEQIWAILQQIPVFEPGLLLLLTILLSRYAALPQQYRPWPLLHLIAQRIAHKVNKKSDSPAHKKLAGALAFLVIFLPLLTLAWTFRQLSEWPAGFDALLLYLCLDYRHFSQQVAVVSDSLQKQQFQLAKDQLQPLLRRDCARLSPTGIAKAGIEVLAQRQLRHLVTVLFWYLLGGAMAAFCYRLILELQQAWSGKISQQRDFAQVASGLGRLGSWPVFWLHGGFLALLYRFFQTLRTFKHSKNSGLPASERWYLSAWSSAVQRNLAGPVMYEAHKLRRERIGPEQAPTVADLQLAQQLDAQIQRLLLLLLCCVLGLIGLYQWPSIV